MEKGDCEGDTVVVFEVVLGVATFTCFLSNDFALSLSPSLPSLSYLLLPMVALFILFLSLFFLS